MWFKAELEAERGTEGYEALRALISGLPATVRWESGVERPLDVEYTVRRCDVDVSVLDLDLAVSDKR